MLKRTQVYIVPKDTGMPDYTVMSDCTACCMSAVVGGFYLCKVIHDYYFNCRTGHFKRLLHEPNKLVASRNKREGHYLGKAKNAEWWRGQQYVFATSTTPKHRRRGSV